MKRALFLLLMVGLVFPLSLHTVATGKSPKKDFIKVIYFYSDYRCSTCMKLEEYSHAAVNKYFTNELKNGSIVWETINYDKDENKHYLDEFNLYNKSLIIIRYEDGKKKEWKNLEKIWELVGKKGKYLQFVKKEIEKYLRKV
jgi:uncharacterized membrane protein